jgi:hypothetical protein
MSATRYRVVSIKDENDEKLELRLRKWSVNKFMSVVRDIGAISESLGKDLKPDKDITTTELVSLVVQLGEQAFDRVVRIVIESCEKPKDLTEDRVKSWDLETFVEVLTAVVEMNFTEGLVKNFKGLRGAVENRLGKILGGPKVPETEPESPQVQ